MCLKRFNWQQYTLSILLLIAVLVSNSSQQKFFNSPRPFQRYSKAVSANNDEFVPIAVPTEYKPVSASTQIVEAVTSETKRKEPETNATPTVTSHADRRTDEDEIDNKEKPSDDKNETETIRNINESLRELREMTLDFLAIMKQNNDGGIQKRSANQQRSFITDYLLNDKVINRIKKFTERYIFQSASGSALQNIVPDGGRLFFFKGFKKLMWPIFIGVQVAKTVLLAMFLPSILGSLSKMVGKGLLSSSGVGHPAETVDDFEFKDNPPVEEPTGAGIGYNYPQQTLTANHANVEPSSYDTAPAANNMLSLYDIAEPKPQFTLANTYTMPEYAQHSRKETLQSKKDDFKVFHDIPASSMLLTNYDPFYSPLLSRLDAVFHQLNLNGDNEACREKLVCLMYSSPAKYMPYSNLVSAQLSRELNELRKPTSDNVEILRFFKYMRAARDGQDGKNCHNIYKKCSSFEDTDQPAMLTTFNDINKLVQARKMQ